MRLDGIHHITAVTADAPGNVDFYARVLGLRLVKKSVNQDDPTVYHLFYGDDQAQPGMDLTFFEYPDLPRGRAGDGMLHTVVWRVASREAIDFWSARLAVEGVATSLVEGGRLRFEDPEGLAHELTADDDGNAPLTAASPDIPVQHALQGFAGIRAFSAHPERSADFLGPVLGFEQVDERSWRAEGTSRRSSYVFDPPPGRGRRGAGTIHHVAWTAADDEQVEWRKHLAAAGADPTPVIDRHYFRSIYFLEPSGVLFEIATPSPGFTVDEPVERLGERLSLPPKFEPLRPQLEQILTPLPNPRVPAGS